MRITLHQLQVFAMVAECQSVTIASRALHMSQPAVSNIIKQLQDYYGCALIEVIGRKLYLTPFGKQLLESCKAIDTTLQNTKTSIEMLKGGMSGLLQVATVSTAKYFVPRMLGEFKQKHRNIDVKLTVCNRQQIIERISENVDDFVIMSHPPTTLAVESSNFFNDELVIAAAYNHKLRRNKKLTLASLADESWIVRESGSGTRYAMERIFKKSRFSPNVAMEIGDNESIKQVVIAGMGVSVVSRQSIRVELQDKLLCMLPAKQFPVNHVWYMVRNKGKSLSPIANSFFEFVKQQEID